MSLSSGMPWEELPSSVRFMEDESYHWISLRPRKLVKTQIYQNGQILDDSSF